MDVAIAGGHGQVALRLERLLAAGGHRARGIIRNPDHAADLVDAGADPVVLDLEAAGVDDVAAAIAGADAVVFAAGAGPGSGATRKQTVDLGAATLLIDACRAAGVDRYVMVSSIGAHAPEQASGAMGPYLAAKAAADDALRASGLTGAIVRPGSLTNDPGTGLVTVSEQMGGRGQIPRDDVAAVLFAVVDGRAAGKTFELFAGGDPIPEALAALG